MTGLTHRARRVRLREEFKEDDRKETEDRDTDGDVHAAGGSVEIYVWVSHHALASVDNRLLLLNESVDRAVL